MLRLPAVAICLYVTFGVVFNGTARAQSAEPADALAAFSKQDNAGAWIEKRNYMRDKQDETWNVRMRTLQSLVAAGEKSIPPLLDALKDGVLQYARLGGNYGDRPKPDEIVERVMKLQE